VKRVQSRRLTALWLAPLTTACALGPSHITWRARAAETLAPEVAMSPPEHGVDALLLKDLENVREEPHLATLPLPGFPDAVVATPFLFDEDPSPRPVVVVVHGLGDWPERHCEAWRNITRARAFVLCPRGAFDGERSAYDAPRYTHPGGAPLRAHLEAALSALSARYKSADTDQPLLAGFSLGATEVALLAQADPARFPRVAVLEGGLDVWFASTIDTFVSRGGRRVLFGCGSPWCPPPARIDIARIDEAAAAGVEARMAFADVGHRPAPDLQAAIEDVFPWFVEGDTRWAN
jgi:dienelactone hydrolase